VSGVYDTVQVKLSDELEFARLTVVAVKYRRQDPIQDSVHRWASSYSDWGKSGLRAAGHSSAAGAL
jgi:hypothetical protein